MKNTADFGSPQVKLIIIKPMSQNIYDTIKSMHILQFGQLVHQILKFFHVMNQIFNSRQKVEGPKKLKVFSILLKI